nr:hypothetical protein [Tanacetum cinerariifolium]
MHRLNVNTLTPDLLAGPTYELMRGSCTSLTELEYHLEEVYKATTNQLDWVNPEGQQYPHNLLQPLPLIPDNRGRRVIPFEHFINNDIEYLRGGALSRKYTTSVTKTKAADYGHIKWIEDLVPREMWIQQPIDYNKHALWGVSHWRRKRKQFYGYAVNRESARDVYSKRRVIAVTELQIMEWHDYKHLDWILVRRDDDQIYKCKEGDFKRLRLQDIEDMLLLLASGRPSTGSGKLPEEAQPYEARSDEQRNLYKALVEAYEADKAILDTYGDYTILKRRREDDDQEGPSVGSNRGSKRQKNGGEQASASTPSEKATEGAGGSTTGSQSRQMSASESAFAEEPVQTTCQMEETPHPVFETGADDQPIVQTSKHPEWFSQPRRPPSPDRAWNTTLPAAQGDAQSWISDLARQTDARSSFNELLDTPIDFSNFIMHWLNVDTLTPDLLTGPTYELMRGSCTSLPELEYHLEEVYKATTDQLDWVNSEGQQYPHNLLQPLPLIPDNRVNRESARDVYSKRRIIAVTELQIVKWHDYKHLDWISVRRDDDQIYKFKEGDFKRLHLQDIEDMLLLL